MCKLFTNSAGVADFLAEAASLEHTSLVGNVFALERVASLTSLAPSPLHARWVGSAHFAHFAHSALHVCWAGSAHFARSALHIDNHWLCCPCLVSIALLALPPLMLPMCAEACTAALLAAPLFPPMHAEARTTALLAQTKTEQPKQKQNIQTLTKLTVTQVTELWFTLSDRLLLQPPLCVTPTLYSCFYTAHFSVSTAAVQSSEPQTKLGPQTHPQQSQIWGV